MEAEPRNPLERKLRPLLAERKVKDAIIEVKDFMRRDKLDPALNTRLHGLYKQQGDHSVTLEHGQQWLTALARAGLGAEALAALRALRAIDPTFSIREGDAVLAAATAAMRAHDTAIAADLLRGFDERFPQHKDTQGAQALRARLMSEEWLRDDKSAS